MLPVLRIQVIRRSMIFLWLLPSMRPFSTIRWRNSRHTFWAALLDRVWRFEIMLKEPGGSIASYVVGYVGPMGASRLFCYVTLFGGGKLGI